MEYLSTFIDEFRDSFETTGNHVFPNMKGKRLTNDSYLLTFKHYLQMVQLERMTPLSLRHAAATHEESEG